jgi:hypothetical protein
VERRYRDAILRQLGHDRIDFSFKQHEIAHHHCAIMCRFERDPTAQSQARLDAHAVDRDLEIAARQSVAMDVS